MSELKVQHSGDCPINSFCQVSGTDIAFGSSVALKSPYLAGTNFFERSFP
jgi:hypothetical protein